MKKLTILVFFYMVPHVNAESASSQLYSLHYQMGWKRALEFLSLKESDVELTRTLDDTADSTALGVKERPTRIFKIKKTGAQCAYLYKQSAVEPKDPNYKKVSILCVSKDGKPTATNGLPDSYSK